MGLLGPPDPNVKTGATNPLWSFTASPLPVFGGVTFLLQAYGIDTSLYPLPEAIMITNAPVVTLN
jgi:hypothetical protein